MQNSFTLHRTILHRHHVTHKQFLPQYATEALPDDQISEELDRGIALVLKAAGFDGADGDARESFRSLTEEYMQRISELVSWSMRRCRRSAPTAWDFEQALSVADVTTEDFQLQTHFQIPPDLAQPSLPSPPPEPPRLDLKLPFLDSNDDLSGRKGDRQFKLPFLPALPDRHTFKSTPSFSTRETDSQKLREAAAEQGRLGEEAIRALVAAGKQTSSAENGLGGGYKKPKRDRDRDRYYDDLWKKMKSGEVEKALLAEESGKNDSGANDSGGNELEIDYGSDGEQRSMLQTYPAELPGLSAAAIGAIVNSDNQYLRKPARARDTKSSKPMAPAVAPPLVKDTIMTEYF